MIENMANKITNILIDTRLSCFLLFLYRKIVIKESAEVAIRSSAFPIVLNLIVLSGVASRTVNAVYLKYASSVERYPIGIKSKTKGINPAKKDKLFVCVVS